MATPLVHIHEQYEFHITVPNGTTWQAYPRNSQLRWKNTQDSTWGFFRETLETDLIFENDPRRSIVDFDKLLEVEESDDRCSFIMIEIRILCNGDWVHRWSGRMRCPAGEWDKSLCILKIKPEVVDEYTCLTDNWETEQDFAGALPGETVEWKPEFNIQTVTTEWDHVIGADSIGRLYMWLDALEGTNLSNLNDPPGSVLVLARLNAIWQTLEEDPSLDDPGAAAWRLLELKVRQDSFGLLKFRVYTKIAREVTIVEPCNVPPSDDPAWIEEEDACPDYSRWVRPAPITYIPTTGMDPDFYGYQLETRVNGIIHKQNLYYSYKLGDVLQWLAGSHPMYPNTGVTCSLPIVSNLFKINPDDTQPSNIAYDKAATFLADVHIQHFSDFLKTENNAAPETRARIKYSLKTILEKLPGNIGIEFRNGALIIEHASYFRRIQMLDLTAADHAAMIKGGYKYKYDKTKLPSREDFTWKASTDGVGKDFDGFPIKYSGACILPDSKPDTISFDIFYSNLAFLVGNKAEFTDDQDGLLILSVAAGAIMFDTCPISGLSKPNGHFAISTLQENYYKWDRPLPTGMMNDQPTTFLRWKRQKLITVKAHLSCEDYAKFKPGDLVKAHPGWGEVEESTYVEMGKILTLELSFH